MPISKKPCSMNWPPLVRPNKHADAGGNKMTTLNSTAVIGALVVMGASMAVAGNVKQTRLNLNPGAVLTIVNGGGSVSLHAGAELQVVINATTYSDKVEVDTRVTADRTRGE